MCAACNNLIASACKCDTGDAKIVQCDWLQDTQSETYAHVNGRYGVLRNGSRTLIAGNFVGCNQWDGIAIAGSAATGSQVIGNHV